MAVSEAITVRCDGDGCQSNEEVLEKGSRPEGWYHIKQADEHDKLQPMKGFDLCGLRCVERWAKARRAIMEEAKQPSSDPRYAKNQECPHCHEMFAPQGLHLHLRSCAAALNGVTT